MSSIAHFANVSAKRSAGGAQPPSRPRSQPYPAGICASSRARRAPDQREVDDVAEFVQDEPVDAPGAQPGAHAAEIEFDRSP
jgi:hypothetical protein